MAYDPPTDENGNELGAPPDSEWDPEKGQWRSKNSAVSGSSSTPPPNSNPFSSSNPALTDPAQSGMIERDKGSWEARLREEAGKAGIGYDPSDLQGIINFTSYAGNAGKDPAEAINRMVENYKQRGSNNRGPDTNIPGQPPPQGPPKTTVGPDGWTTDSRSNSYPPSTPAYDDTPLRQALLAQTQMMQQFQDANTKRNADLEARYAADRATEQTRRDSLYNQLLTRAQQGTQIDPNDPVIKAQVDSYRAEAERANRNYMSDLAESSGPYANLRGEQRMGAEKIGQGVGGLRSQLLGRELQSRRDEIAQSLAGLGGMLSADQAANMQRELGMYDNQLKGLGLGLQGAGNLIQGELGSRGLDNDLVRAMLQNQQFYSNLGSQEDMFKNRLGFDVTDRSNYWDALRSGLL